MYFEMWNMIFYSQYCTLPAASHARFGRNGLWGQTIEICTAWLVTVKMYSEHTMKRISTNRKDHITHVIPPQDRMSNGWKRLGISFTMPETVISQDIYQVCREMWKFRRIFLAILGRQDATKTMNLWIYMWSHAGPTAGYCHSPTIIVHSRTIPDTCTT